MVPTTARRNARSDFRARFNQTLGFQRFQRFTKNGSRNVEMRYHIRVIRQGRPNRIFTRYDPHTNLVDHVRVKISRRHSPRQGANEAPWLAHRLYFPSTERPKPLLKTNRCKTINRKSRKPMTILVHQLESVPSKTIYVCTSPCKITPTKLPNMKP